jgi:hypothetical protein
MSSFLAGVLTCESIGWHILFLDPEGVFILFSFSCCPDICAVSMWEQAHVGLVIMVQEPLLAP